MSFRSLGQRGVSLAFFVLIAAAAGCGGGSSGPADGAAGKDGGGKDGGSGGAGGKAGTGGAGSGGATGTGGGAAGADGGTDADGGGSDVVTDVPATDVPATDVPATDADGGGSEIATDVPVSTDADGGGGADGSTDADGGGGSDGGAGTGGGDVSVPLPLTIDISTSSDPAVPNQNLLYTVTIGNVSAQAVAGVGLLFRVPTGVQFSYNADVNPDGSFCGNGACTANEEVTWTLGSLAAGETRSIVINAGVLNTLGAGDIITAPFTLTATGLSPVIVNKVVPVAASVLTQLSLGTAKYPVTPSQKFTLDLDVGQIGAAALANATLRATLPAGVTVSAISDGGTQDASDVTWTLGSVAVGALLHRQIEVTVGAAALPGSILKTRATLTYDGGLALDNVAEYAVPVAATAPPLTIDVAATPDPAVPGGNVLYTVTLGNQAARALEGVSVILRTPSALAFSYNGDVQPDGSFCGNGLCSADEEVVWDFGTLAAGATQSFVINAEVQAAAAGDGSLIRASFGVTATGIAQLNAIKTVQVFSHPGAQLALGTVVNPITPGQAFTLNADVGQIGTTALATTELRVKLPAGLTAGAISDGGTQAASGDIVWAIGNVAVSGVLHRTVALTAGASVVPGAVLVTRASLTHDGGPPVDAQAQHAIYVAAVAEPLTVAVVATPSPVAPNTRLLYTTTITNSSARAITDIALLWRLPVGMQFSYNVDTNPDASFCGNGACTAGEEVSWTIPTLAAGANQIITVNALVLGTLLEGSLISISSRTTATGLVDPILVETTVPAHQ